MKASVALILLILGAVKTEDVNLNFQQHDYDLKFERLEVPRYDKGKVKDVSVTTFKYNRTMAVVNATFTTKISLESLAGVVQVYKFMSNEYRYFPIHFAANACRALEVDTLGMSTAFARCGNIKGCPFLKGMTYKLCNWYPDSSKFPPLIPNGQYKIEIQLSHSSQELAVLTVLATISRPLV